VFELAWAAGFFDGEGSSGCYVRAETGRCYLRVALAQVEREPLDRFVAALGEGRVRGPYPARGRRQPNHWVEFNGPTARRVMRRLWPHLTTPKKCQWLRALARQRAMRQAELAASERS
jgi:hypothetical protein